MTSNRVSRMSVQQHENFADSFDRKLRVRNQSCSASSTMSSTSSNSSTSAPNQNYLIDVSIVYPNGFQIAKKLDNRKAVYDILIELSATAKLIPTNYTLKLFSKDENNSNNYKSIDYTPNQTIGHLNPAKITIIPKTSTLKHQQHQILSSVEPESRPLNQILTVHTLSNKSTTLSKTPFELTVRVGVNLPFNQKSAVRVRPNIPLTELFECVCKEAGLDPKRYDLVINSHLIQESMHETFDLYKTNEVSLVLKSYDKPPNRLNSKSSISIFNQNSTKSRSQKKLITNKTNQLNSISNQESTFCKFKSKSELDLSSNLDDSSKQNFKNSTSNLSTKTSQSSMFSFFTRKKKSKSKLSVNDDSTSLKSSTLRSETLSSHSTIKSVSSSNLDNQYLLAKVNKKRQAPPPPQTANLNSVPEGNESDKPNGMRSKSVVHNRNPLSDLDQEALERIMALTKKKKKAAPLPPTQLPSDKNESLKVITSLSPKSEILKVDENDSDKSSTSPPSFPSPSLSESSSVLSSKDQAPTRSNDEDTEKCSLNDDYSIKQKAEDCRNRDIDSLAGETFSTCLMNVTQSTSLPTHQNVSVASKVNEESIMTDDTKKLTDDSILTSDENCVKSFYGAVSDHKIYAGEDFSDVDSIKTVNSPIVTTSPLHNHTYAVQSMPNQVTKIVINKNIESPKMDQTPLKLDTKIPNVLVEANDKSYVQNYEDEFDKPDFDETQLEINVNSYRTPVKKTAIIEVRPEFETSSLIRIVNQEEHKIEEQVLKSPGHKRSSIHLMIKSPVSPPPQFPAIGENEMNEQHQNYTVVRSGDIIEKNGIYYSTDGTVRGYSGIVKKLANSKALNEVFQKQQELEQQQNEAYKKEQEERIKHSPINSNTRTSLGKIVANEKKITPITTGLVKTVQYRKPTETRNFTKSTLDDELSKKLETRRQTIANQVNNLEIDTSSSLQSTSSSCTSPSINDSSSQNSPQSYFMSQNLHTINQRKNTPSFVMSAKVRDSKTNSPENVALSRASLLEELKSLVPLTDGENKPNSIPPSPPVMSTFQPNRPIVAPKNFNHNTIESIQSKKQILNARDDLLDSIKSFSLTALKKVNRDIN